MSDKTTTKKITTTIDNQALTTEITAGLMDIALTRIIPVPHVKILPKATKKMLLVKTPWAATLEEKIDNLGRLLVQP